MLSCDHKMPSSTSNKRKKRAVANELTAKVPYDVSLIPSNLPEAIEVFNKSLYNYSICHELNMSAPVKPVQVYIKHNLNFTLKMLIGFNNKPTDEKNYKNFTVNETASVLLSVEEVSNFVNESMNGTVYVCVRSSGKATFLSLVCPQCQCIA